MAANLLPPQPGVAFARTGSASYRASTAIRACDDNRRFAVSVRLAGDAESDHDDRGDKRG
jgi:hypothetical protein